jgi:hypothetical protein
MQAKVLFSQPCLQEFVLATWHGPLLHKFFGHTCTVPTHRLERRRSGMTLIASVWLEAGTAARRDADAPPVIERAPRCSDAPPVIEPSRGQIPFGARLLLAYLGLIAMLLPQLLLLLPIVAIYPPFGKLAKRLSRRSTREADGSLYVLDAPLVKFVVAMAFVRCLLLHHSSTTPPEPSLRSVDAPAHEPRSSHDVGACGVLVWCAGVVC